MGYLVGQGDVTPLMPTWSSILRYYDTGKRPIDRQLRLEFHGVGITSDAGHGRRMAVYGFSRVIDGRGTVCYIGLDSDESRVYHRQESEKRISIQVLKLSESL